VFGSGSGVATVPMPARSFSNHTERLITVIKTQKARANNTLSIERRSKVERRQWYSSGEKPALDKKSSIEVQTPPGLLDRPLTTASNFFSYSSTLRGCPTKFSLVDAGGIFSSTAHFLILIAGLTSQFTNSIRFLPSLVVLTNARSPGTFALLSICSSVSDPYFAISSGLLWHFSISTL